MRLGLGARPGELDTVAPDPRAWLHDQIVDGGADQPPGDLPDSVSNFDTVQQLEAEMERLGRRVTLSQINAFAAAESKVVSALANAEIYARMSLACQTPAGFRERWAQFWADHFYVTADSAPLNATVGAFEREAIRPHVFGRLEDLALAALKHPSMLMAYEQANSAGPDSPAVKTHGGGYSENLGRESLELHILGREADYTQADVREMSLALTGWSIGAPSEQAAANTFVYRAENHEPGARTILGQRFPEGATQPEDVVRGLSRRPEAARHVARKIAQHFVCDNPPALLVDRLAAVHVQTGGRLDAIAHTLIDAPETWNPAAGKFKTPKDLYISVNRALDRTPASPDEPANVCASMEQPFHGAPSPRGWTDMETAWVSPSGLVKRLVWLRTLDSRATTDGELAKLATTALGPRLRPATLNTIKGQAWSDDHVALLFMSPEFQRR